MSKLTIDEPGFAEQMLKDVQINPEDLDSGYIEQASLFAFYAEQSRLATKKMDNFKLRIGAIEAELDKQIRNEAAEAGTKYSEKQILSLVESDSKYVKAVMAYNDAKATAQMLRDILDAFKHRKDMLVAIGLDKRAGLSATGMRLNEDQMQARREKMFGRTAEAA